MAGFSTDVGRIAGELPDPLLILDADGAITWTDHAADELFAISPGAWLGRTLLDQVHDLDRAAAREALTPQRTGQPGRRVEVRVPAGDGGWRPVRLQARPLPARGSDDGGVVVVLRATDPRPVD